MGETPKGGGADPGFHGGEEAQQLEGWGAAVSKGGPGKVSPQSDTLVGKASFWEGASTRAAG